MAGNIFDREAVLKRTRVRQTFSPYFFDRVETLAPILDALGAGNHLHIHVLKAEVTPLLSFEQMVIRFEVSPHAESVEASAQRPDMATRQTASGGTRTEFPPQFDYTFDSRLSLEDNLDGLREFVVSEYPKHTATPPRPTAGRMPSP